MPAKGKLAWQVQGTAKRPTCLEWNELGSERQRVPGAGSDRALQAIVKVRFFPLVKKGSTEGF